MSSILDDEDVTFICNGHRVHPSAIADVKARYGYEQVDEPLSVWLPKQRETSPHWFIPEPKEPSDEDEDAAVFTSADAQAAYIREHGRDALAAKLAERGMKIGQVAKREPKPVADAAKPSTNPWSDTWRGTPEQRQAAQLRVITTGGAKLASQLAKAGGKTITGQPLRGK